MSDGRYFFALWPDDEVRLQISAMSRRMTSKGRAHHPKDLHMTLVFLGQITDSQLRCINDAADKIHGRPFTLHLDRIDYWPRPRILWAGPEKTPEPLNQLVFDLKNSLIPCGLEPERRKYKPHVTLHRKAESIGPGGIAPSIEWPATDFVLAVSGGGAEGSPRYRVLQRWPLDAAGPHPTKDNGV